MAQRVYPCVRAWPAALMATGLALLAGCGETPRGQAGVTAGGDGAVAASAPAERERLRTSPQARDWADRKRFEQDARNLVREAPGLSAAERDARARQLEAEIGKRERSGELSAGETVLLRAAMIESQAGTSEEQARRMAELVTRYREDATQREAAWLTQQQRDPRMQQYKSREQAVVTEVMAMDSFPNGMTRDQYLRLRLQQEREAAWGTTR